MSIIHDRPEGDVPWYLLKSSILMITVTILAVLGIAFDYSIQDKAPDLGYRIVDNGMITMPGDRKVPVSR